MDVHDYSALGWPTFPCRYRSKQPLTINGFLAATIDPTWRLTHQHCNVGLACDERSGLLAIDVDPRNGGDEEWNALAQLGTPYTPCQLSGGPDGGYHLVFRRPAGRCRASIAPGVDVRANGYILVEPSLHPSGGKYMWDAGAHPLDVPVAELPPWLLWRVMAKEYVLGEALGPAADSAAAKAFARAGLLLHTIDDTRVAVRCPLASQHSTDGRTSTVIFAPTAQSPLGRLHCSHTTHGRVTTQQALVMIGEGWW